MVKAKIVHRLVPLLAASLALAQGAAPKPAAKAAGGIAQDGVVENVRIPLDAYPDGQIRARLTAERADVSLTNAVSATGVQVELFASDGTLDALLACDDVRLLHCDLPDPTSADGAARNSLEGLALAPVRIDSETRGVHIVASAGAHVFPQLVAVRNPDSGAAESMQCLRATADRLERLETPIASLSGDGLVWEERHHIVLLQSNVVLRLWRDASILPVPR